MHTVMYKNFELEIESGVLCSMCNTGAPCEVIIPKILPNGEQITKLGAEFLKGEYKRVVIPVEITEIAEGAFKNATVNEIVWSAGCKIIPQNCFQESCLREISGIEMVH
ncbi:MAG: leucine-rich repeat domain-containing protein, partial [Eubacterium sp.]|nr:leucine-rich repeat domain-containing protein [Eubacterium sp.]